MFRVQVFTVTKTGDKTAVITGQSAGTGTLTVETSDPTIKDTATVTIS